MKCQHLSTPLGDPNINSLPNWQVQTFLMIPNQYSLLITHFGWRYLYWNNTRIARGTTDGLYVFLTHWGRVTHICVSKLTNIGSDNGSDNGLSPGRRQAIIWTIAGILLIRPLGTNFSEIVIEINTSSFKKMHWKMSSGKCRPFVSASMC